MERRLVSQEKPHGNRNMGEFELAAGVLHIYLITPQITPISHDRNGCDITTTTGWNNHQCITRSEVAGSLLRHHALILQERAIAASIVYLPGDKKILANAAL